MKTERSRLTKKVTKIEPMNPEKRLNYYCYETLLIKIKASQ